MYNDITLKCRLESIHLWPELSETVFLIFYPLENAKCERSAIKQNISQCIKSRCISVKIRNSYHSFLIASPPGSNRNQSFPFSLSQTKSFLSFLWSSKLLEYEQTMLLTRTEKISYHSSLVRN